MSGQGFPVLGEDSEIIAAVPWAVIQPHEAQARKNHYQSLERLAERGGLCLSEMAAVLEDRPWRSMPIERAAAVVREKCLVELGLGRVMVVCPTCGNKRCPKATDDALDCSGSNEPGQPGSAYGRATP